MEAFLISEGTLTVFQENTVYIQRSGIREFSLVEDRAAYPNRANRSLGVDLQR